MTADKLKRMFPHASYGFIVANATSTEEVCDDETCCAESERAAVKADCKLSTDEAKLNKTEKAYLQYLRGINRHPWIGVQNMTFKLAHDTRFTPDFSTLDVNGQLTFIDVKGFQREDALIKIKVAARLFPWATWVIVKRNGNGWLHEEIKP